MSEPPDVPFPDRSTEPCPRCGRHDLALTQPPHVPVMGAQPYTEIYRLGDLPMPVGVRCRSCGTTWPTIEALRAGEPGTSGEIDPVEGLETSDEAPGSGGPEAGATAEPPVAASSRASRQAGILALSVVLVAVLLLSFLFANVLFVPLVVLLMAAGLVAGTCAVPGPEGMHRAASAAAAALTPLPRWGSVRSMRSVEGSGMRQRATWAAMLVVAGALLPVPGTAQSPAPSAPSAADCGVATNLRFPLRDPAASLAVPFAFEDPTLANPDPSFAGRFHPDETWTLPGGGEGAAVLAPGPGLVVAAGPVGAGDQGGIVVLEHAGPFTLPPSLPGDPFVHDATTTASLLTVLAGVDPLVVPGECVPADAVIGTITAACGPGVAPPCSDLPPGLRLGVRLGETADPARRSADWSVAGPPGDSIGGTFPDPQVMVDDGVRGPSRAFVALAAPCPAPSSDAAASAVPCDPPLPSGSPLPSAEPSTAPSPAAPTPAPTPRPVASPAVALQQGLPKGVRGTCTKRSTRLVTGTLAAVDCTPADPAIELMSYFLGRPADSRFTFNSRAREQDLGTGGDCAESVAGVESRKAGGSVLCYRDENGRANLRFAVSDTCPGVYIGVLGTGKDIGRLAAAVDRLTGGTVWRADRATVAACKGDDGRVSAPPVPTNVHLATRLTRKQTPKDPFPPLRATFTWDIPVTADTTVEIWGVRDCLRKPPRGGSVPCIGKSTRIPSSQLVLLGSAPAAAGEVSWLVPLDEIMGGWAFHDAKHGWMSSVVARAVNERARSRFALIPEALGEACDGCVY